jgi:hypothetical protein
MKGNRTPQDNDFNLGKKFSLAENILYIVSYVVAMIQYHTSYIPEKCFLILTSIILILIYFANQIKENKIQDANGLRRKFFFDNAFGMKKFPHNNQNYYDNEEVDLGLKKTLANIHENALFTSKIVKRMCTGYYIFAFILSITFILSLFSNGLTELNAILLGFILSGSIVGQTIRLCSVKNETIKVFLDANEICDSYNKTQKIEDVVPEILNILVRYEVITSSNTIVLSDYLYTKMNQDLTQEWNELKTNYKIYE